MLFYVKARSPRHFFSAQISLKKNCSLLNVVFIYSQIRLIWCKASTDRPICWFDPHGLRMFWHTNFKSKYKCVHICSQKYVSITWSIHEICGTSTACVDSLVRCLWLAFIFIYQFQVSDHIYSRKYVRTAWSVHEIWAPIQHACVELLVRC